MTTNIFEGLHVLLALKNTQASESLKDMLMRQQVGVFAAENNRDAVEKMLDHIYNLIVIDEFFPDLGGVDFCRFIRLTNSPMAVAPIIFGIYEPDQKKVLQARDAGATKIAVMPFSATSLMKSIEAAVTDQRSIVQHTSYNGPDRRTRQMPPPGGVDRRNTTPNLITKQMQLRVLKPSSGD